jgi:hypothetical protein
VQVAPHSKDLGTFLFRVKQSKKTLVMKEPHFFETSGTTHSVTPHHIKEGLESSATPL